jgi:hypothetical protein
MMKSPKVQNFLKEMPASDRKRKLIWKSEQRKAAKRFRKGKFPRDQVLEVKVNENGEIQNMEELAIAEREIRKAKGL